MASKILWFLLLWSTGVPLTLQAQQQERGQVLEKVVCRDNPNQSYALYLPSNYTADRKWPIIYALDPGARGILPVQRFTAAAEKFGYIVAGSNNSQNGPIEIIEKALNAMVADTESRFVLDSRRVYMAGFSGGARAAVDAAVAMKGKAAGVIGCGAGFPSAIPLSASRAFAFFGAVGVEDFNFPEMRALDESLEKLGSAHKLDIFSGGHEWPPEAMCIEALEWLEIQAMKSGILNPDAERIEEMYSSAIADARSCESRKEIYEAYQRYSALAKDFNGLKDVHIFEAKAEELRKSGEVRKAASRERAANDEQQRLVAQLDDLMAGAFVGENRAFQLQKLTSNFIFLQEQAQRPGNETDRLVARRVLNLFWVRLNQDASLDFENKDYSRAAIRMELMTRIRPENPRIFYHLSRAYARGGERKNALRALKDAVSKGFKDSTQLRSSPDFETIRSDPAFQNILDDLDKKQSSF